VRVIAAGLGCGESNVRERARVEGWPARRQPRSGSRPLLPYRIVETCADCGALVTTAYGVPADCPRCAPGVHTQRLIPARFRIGLGEEIKSA
jgi:hypothetical protein